MSKGKKQGGVLDKGGKGLKKNYPITQLSNFELFDFFPYFLSFRLSPDANRDAWRNHLEIRNQELVIRD